MIAGQRRWVTATPLGQPALLRLQPPAPTRRLQSSCRMVFTMRSGLSSEEERLRISSTPRNRKKSWMLNSRPARSTPCMGVTGAEQVRVIEGEWTSNSRWVSCALSSGPPRPSGWEVRLGGSAR